jgi:zinc transporter
MNAVLADATYGCDAVGLVCGFRFTRDGAGVELDSDGAAAWLARSAACADDGSAAFVWLHFNLAHAACMRWMDHHLDLPETFFEALREGSHSTRIEHANSALLAVVNDVKFTFDLAPTEISTLWAYARENLLVTARRAPLRSVDQLRSAVRHGEVFHSTAALLLHLLRDQADLLIAIVRRTSAEVDALEDAFLSHKRAPATGDLGTMRRMLVRLQRLLAPEPGSLFRLLNRPPAWIDETDLQDLLASTEEFSLVLADLGGLVERIRLLQEEIGARLNEQNNRTLFTLTLVTVLALPINIVAGFFGMNVGGIPFAENRHGFWLMVFIVAGFTALAGWWTFRRRSGG